MAKKKLTDEIKEAANLTKKSPAERKKTITLFMIIVFSVLLAMSAYETNWFMKLWFQIILLISQLVIVKALLDDYYS